MNIARRDLIKSISILIIGGGLSKILSDHMFEKNHMDNIKNLLTQKKDLAFGAAVLQKVKIEDIVRHLESISKDYIYINEVGGLQTCLLKTINEEYENLELIHIRGWTFAKTEAYLMALREYIS